MAKLEFLKFVLTPVLVERNDEGVIVGEQTVDTTVAYTRNQLLEAFETIQAAIERHNAEQ